MKKKILLIVFSILILACPLLLPAAAYGDEGQLTDAQRAYWLGWFAQYGPVSQYSFETFADVRHALNELTERRIGPVQHTCPGIMMIDNGPKPDGLDGFCITIDNKWLVVPWEGSCLTRTTGRDIDISYNGVRVVISANTTVNRKAPCLGALLRVGSYYLNFFPGSMTFSRPVSVTKGGSTIRFLEIIKGLPVVLP